MANWALTDYVIEGPDEILEKIQSAVNTHEVEENSSDNWEGNILHALGITWEKGTPKDPGPYVRGFIQDAQLADGILSLHAEEAWGVTDFCKLLKEKFPEIKVYWASEEPDCEVYQTNDKDGKYFKDKFYVDTCIHDNYQSEYFMDEKAAYKWLDTITTGEVKTLEDVCKFNDSCDEDDYISIYEFEVVNWPT